MNDLRYLIFDTETTGIDEAKQAVEIAMIEVDADMNIVGDEQALLKPTVPITEKAAAIHGITEDMLAGCPTIDEWVAQVLGGPLEGNFALIGHRIGFDKPLFAPIGNCVTTLDTLQLAHQFVSDAPNKKLDTLKEHLSLPGGGTSHRAMADVITCYQLLQYILPLTGRMLHELITDPQPYTVHYMPWGKYEGTLLMNVPRSYRQYMLNEMKDLDPNLRRSVEAVMLLDPPLKAPVPGARVKPNIPPRRIL